MHTMVETSVYLREAGKAGMMEAEMIALVNFILKVFVCCLFVVVCRFCKACSLYGWIDLILFAIKKRRGGAGEILEAFIPPSVPRSQ